MKKAKRHIDPYISDFIKKDIKGKKIYIICGMSGIMSPDRVRRTYGWYSSLKQAQDAVKKNVGDLFEQAYWYLVIEEVPEGAWRMAWKSWWYKWDNKREKYLPINKPKGISNVFNFGIG